MKNRTGNKKVLRAMSIGLAAMMAVQPVMATPVFADDLDTQGETNTEVVDAQNEEKVTESTTTQDNLKEIQKSYDDAAEAVSNIGYDLNTAVQADRVDPDFTSTDGASTKLTELNNAVTGTEIGAVDATILDGDRRAASDAAITLVNDAKRAGAEFELDADELMKAGVKDNLKGDAIKQAAKAVDDAINEESKALDKLEEDTNKLTIELTGIEGTINVKTGEIDRATSIPVATEALDEATEAKNTADEKFEQAKDNCEQAEKALVDKKDEIARKKAEYEKMLEAAVADESALKKTEAELIQDEEDLEALEAANKKAQEDLKKTTIGMLADAFDITSEENVKYDSKGKQKDIQWGKLDLIFIDTIKYYYAPSLKEDPTLDIKTIEFDNAVTKDSSNSNNNYYRIKIIKNDDSFEYKYFNYKTQLSYENKIVTNSFVIFEKNPGLIKDKHYENGENEYSVDTVEENAIEVENGVLSFESDPVNGTYILDGTQYYVVNQSETVEENNFLTENSTAANTVTTYSLNSTGDVLKTIKGDVTTTMVAESVSLVASGSNMSLAEATTTATNSKASCQVYTDGTNAYRFVDDVLYKIGTDGELTKVTEDVTVTAYQDVNDTYSVDASAKATVDFTGTFTTTVSLKGLRTSINLGEMIFTKATEEAKQEINRNMFGDTESGFWHSIENIFEDNKSTGIIQLIKDTVSTAGYEVKGFDFEKVTNVSKIQEKELLTDYYEAQDGSLSLTFTKKLTTKEEEGIYSQNNLLESEVSSINAKLNAENDAKTKAENNKAVNADSKAKELELSNAVAQIIINAIKNSSAGETYNFGELALSTDGSSTIEDKSKRTYDEAKVSTTGTASYGYEVKGTTVSKLYDVDATVSTTVYNADALTYVAEQYAAIPLLNDYFEKYYKDGEKVGDIIDLREGSGDAINDAIRGDVKNVKDLAAKYKEAETKATKAKKKVAYAKEKVQDLIAQIEALISENAAYDKAVEDELAKLEAKLIAAKSKLDEAEAEKAKVDAAYERALEAYDAAVRRLTPSESEPDYTPFVAEPAPSVAIIGGDVVAPRPVVLPTATAPAAGVAGARTRRAGNGTGAGYLEETAGGELITGDELKGELPVVDKDEKATEITDEVIKTIQDEQVPLAAFPENETAKINWWWLLLIAVLGVTGEEMYRRNEKKKEEKAALSAEMNKKNK